VLAAQREPLSKFLPGASLSEAAQAYAAFRFCIFPVTPRNKQPALGGHGWHDATGNQLQIRRWWKENPEYNIGIALPLSGLAVLDIDARHGGLEALDTLIETHGELPATYTVKTGGGGFHYYYRIDDQEYDLPKNIAPGVELLRNGYVVAPPSDTSKASNGGGLYTVESYNDDNEFHPLPIQWINKVLSQTHYARIESELPNEEEWTLVKGERNEMITRFMGMMRRYGFNANELERMVSVWDTDRIEDFEEMLTELPTIAKSVSRYPPDAIGPRDIHLSVKARIRKPMLEPVALYGPIGEWVKFIANRSESHPAALLMQALAIFGNRIGSEYADDACPGFLQGESYHRTALYIMVIGDSGRGAKGDSWNYARSLLKRVDPTFYPHEGVQTGEGFIEVLADDIPLDEHSVIQGEKVQHIKKGGQRDRRFFNFEPEYGRVLHVASRTGATIKDIVRALWDYGSTAKVTAGSQHSVSNVTLSMVAHVTPPELERDFDQVDLMSGYGNRFLFCWSERTRTLKQEYPLTKEEYNQFVPILIDALEYGHEDAPEDYEFTDEARELWTDEVSRWKAAAHPSSMVHALKSRFRPQVKRLAVIYAVSDQSDVIDVPHLQAALAVWDYSVQTVEYCLADQIGDKDANKLYQALLESPSGLTRKEVYAEVFKMNKSSQQIDRAVKLLKDRNLIIEKKMSGRTKSTTIWIARNLSRE
jgi:hypothetical protein